MIILNDTEREMRSKSVFFMHDILLFIPFVFLKLIKKCKRALIFEISIPLEYKNGKLSVVII